MAISTVGYDGSVDEVAIAKMAALWGVRHVVGGTADFKVSAVAGARQVSVAAGTAYASFILVTSDSAVTPAAWTLASGGQWHLVVLRRDWSGSGSAAITVLAGATTTTSTPSTVPTSFPAAYQSAPGTVDDQPLAWVWVSSSTTTVQVFDMRALPGTSWVRANVDGVYQVMVATNSWSNSSTWQPLGGADATAVARTFTKLVSSSRLLVRAAATMELASGVSQLGYFGVRINGTDYEIDRVRFEQAPNRQKLTNALIIPAGIAAGTFTVTLVFKGGPASVFSLYGGEDAVSYTIEEIA